MACFGCLGTMFFPLLGVVSLIVGLIGFFGNPQSVIRWGSPEHRNKKQVLMVYGSICFGSFLFSLVSMAMIQSSVPATISTPAAHTPMATVTATKTVEKVVPPMGKLTSEKPARSRVAPTEAPPPVKTEPAYKMNEWFTCGDFRYCFTGVQKAKQIGTEYNNEKPSEGAVFLLVFFTEENMDKKTKTVSNDRFWIIDSQDREFRASSKGSLTLAVQYKQEWLMSEIQPGIKHKAVTLFEIPEDATGLKIKIPAGLSNSEIVFPVSAQTTAPAAGQPPPLPGAN